MGGASGAGLWEGYVGGANGAGWQEGCVGWASDAGWQTGVWAGFRNRVTAGGETLNISICHVTANEQKKKKKN